MKKEQSQKAFSEEKTWRRILIEQSSDGIVILDVNGSVVEANNRFAEMHGYSPEEAGQLHIWDWSPALSPGHVPDNLVTIDERGDHFEIVHRCKDGSLIDTEISSNAAWFGQRKLIFCVCRDITERKNIEARLRQSEFRFRELVDKIGTCVAVYEAANGGEDFLIKDFNRSAEKVEQITRAEITGRPVTAVFPGIRKFGLLDVMRRVWKTGEPEHYPISYYQDRRISGWKENYVYRLPSGEIVVSYEDFTQQEKAKQALKQSEENFRNSLDNSPLGIHIVNPKGELLYANKAILDIYGYPSFEELKKTPAEKRYTPESFASFQSRVAKRQKGEYVPDQFEVSILRKDGQVRDLQVLHKEIIWNGEKNFQTVYQDITERKKAISRELEIEALQKINQAKSELLANVSHELRTPLASIKGFIETLIEPDVTWTRKQQKEFLNLANQEVDRLSFLIRDLLDMSRIDSGKMVLDRRNCTIRELLDSVSGVLSVMAHNHKLTVNFEPDLPLIQLDRTRIGQVLTNLVENATKFSACGSRISIEVKAGYRCIEFIVADQGEGMTEETIANLFNRFYQAQRVVSGKTRGTGLGLAICKGIVEAHGGHIKVQSRPGKGTTFTFSLPLDPGSRNPLFSPPIP